MTKALPSGTRNVAVNMIEGEFRIIDRLAFDAGVSTNEFIRRNLRRGIAMTKPDAAKLLIQIRRARTAAKVVICLGFVGLFLCKGQDERRSSRTVRVRRQEVSEVEALV